MGNMSEKIYLGGKSLALLRKVVADHSILTGRGEPPSLDVCLTETQLQHSASESSTYIERVREMVQHRLYTRKIALEEKEAKRVELIHRAQSNQAARLTQIYSESLKNLYH